jgi:hypothetical protein
VGANLGWLVNPSEVVGADSLGAIARVMAQTQAPVVVTVALGVQVAHAVTGAGIITFGISHSHEGQHKGNSSQHCLLPFEITTRK